MTLVEVLVGLAILAFVALGVMSFLATVMKQNQLALQRSVATGLASERIQQITSMPFQTIANYANRLTDLGSTYGNNMSSLLMGTAGAISQAEQAANNTVTQAGTQGLLAGQQASANTWGAIFGGLTAGAKLAGSSSFGSLVGSLFK